MDVSYLCTGAGAGGKHCCHVGGKPCVHLVENVAGRRFACSLLVKHGGDWDAALVDPGYKPIGDFWTRDGRLPFDYCRQFDPAFCCRPEMRAGKTHDRFDTYYGEG